MKLHPNYIKALEDKYSDTSFEKDIKEYEDTHLYMSYKKVWNCKIFDGTPKLEIINEEGREFTYNYYKYEGKIKKEFQVEQTFYFLNSYYDQHIKGQEIILDVYALKEKNPNKSLEDLYNDMKDKNYEDFEYLEDPYFDPNATVFVISEAIDEDYSPEVICQGNFNISEFDDRDGDNKYTYLEEEGPFKFLNPCSGEWDDVYVEYEDNYGHTYCSLEWKAKGRDGYGYGAISNICLNIEKYGKKNG